MPLDDAIDATLSFNKTLKYVKFRITPFDKPCMGTTPESTDMNSNISHGKNPANDDDGENLALKHTNSLPFRKIYTQV